MAKRQEAPPEVAEEINARSRDLIDEFYEHLAEVQQSRQARGKAEMDQSTAFEGWCIQKIAGLQTLVLQLVERVESLETKRR